MEITFLGTSQAVPTKEKNHTSILISHGSQNIIVDCGEGTQRQFRIANLNPCKLTAIFITHWHGDHVLGISGLLQTLALNNYSQTLNIYGPRGTNKYLYRMLNMFVFLGKIKIKVHEIGNAIIEIGDLEITSREMRHSTPCLAYSIKEKDKRNINLKLIKKLQIPHGPLLGKLQKGQDIMWQGKKVKANMATKLKIGKKIAIILDTVMCKNCIEIARNSDLLIASAVYLSELEAMAKERKHLTARDTAIIAKQAKVKKLMLTHISNRYDKNNNEILKETRKVFRNSELAHDLMKIVL